MGNQDRFGEETFDRSNRTYLDLRAGYIAETTKTLPTDPNTGEPLKREIEKWTALGYELRMTENKAKVKSYFMAKIKKSISGYVTALNWYSNRLETQNVTLTGWKVVIETPTQTYWLQISSKDRPFQQFMNSFLAVDFDHTVTFKGYEKEGKKNLLLYQGDSDGKDFIRGVHEMKMVNKILRDKIKHKEMLNDQDRQALIFTEDGEVDAAYPYIFQREDTTWNFENWNDFLKEQVETYALPAIETANQKRDPHWKGDPAQAAPDQAAPDQEGYGEHVDDEPGDAYEPPVMTTPPHTGTGLAAAVAQAPVDTSDDIPF